MKKLSVSLSKRNYVFMAICGGGLLLLFLISILPILVQKENLTQQIPILEKKIQDQKNIEVLLKTLQAKLNNLDKLILLPEVKEQPIAISESGTVISRVTALTIENNMKLTSIKPLVPIEGKNISQISFSAQLKGTLSDIRSFIYSLLQVPYMKSIDNIDIDSSTEGLTLSLVFTIQVS